MKQSVATLQSLESKQNELKASATKLDSAITDLQCRSIGDNLIFTGIEEPE